VVSAWDFAGTERFEVLRRIGSGAMGVVYEARDRQYGRRVALKVLKQLEAGTLLRFKQEFRALADATHPNLVRLHELVCEDGVWFVTMELVDGTDFLAWVRPGHDAGPAVPSTQGPGETWIGTAADPPPGPGVAGGRLDERRLREALRQLRAGVAALHRLGKLHRDIKPSNVVVTRDGRVVLLDFGLIKELLPAGVNDSLDAVVGTPGYMAPEQAAGGEVTEASDWYSVGTMLYEALTGRLPFTGTTFEILFGKQRGEAPPPGELVEGLPADLEAMCRTLIRRDPGARTAGAELLARLDGGAEPAALPAARPDAAPVLGRRAERDALDDAFRVAAGGAAVTLVVHGRSGIGKSTLVRRFLDDLGGRAVVLAGRCYERESVPYKALDTLIDALARHLLRLPEEQVVAVLPRDVAALARLFPVLGRIGAVAAARSRGEVPDAGELRRRASGALRDLLTRMADRRPLVLFIDDLQWGDPDSGALLADLLAPPEPPALLLLACHRSENAAASPLLARLVAPRPGVEVRELTLGPLADDEARALARALLGDASPPGDARPDRIAREAQGSPFLLVQLAQHLRGGAYLDSGEIRFEQIMQDRLAELPDDARRLLEVIAVAGGPVGEEPAREAAAVVGADALAVLRAGQLVRSGAVETVECSHDRIRETVVALLSPATVAAHHGALARALEAAGADDPEAVSLHYHAAGDPGRAGAWAETAAGRASQALAFDRAAELYRRALRWAPRGDDERRELTARLADALAGAGRGREAAEAYRVAAAGAAGEVALIRRQRAAHQLLRAGYVDEGEAELAGVLAELGVGTPGSSAHMLATVAWNRLRIRAGGYRAAAPAAPAPGPLLRVDACWSAATGLGTIDYLKAAYFQTRHLLEALALGEPSRLAGALAMEACTLVTSGGAEAVRKSDELRARARALAAGADDPRATATATLFAAMTDIQLGQWASALALFEQAEAELRDRCTDVAWELDSAELLGGICRIRLGRLDEMQRRVPRLLDEAEARGALYLAASVPGFHHMVWLAADEPAALRSAEAAAMARWSPRRYHVQHLCALHARIGADLYEGDGGGAWRRLEAEWSRLVDSMLFRAHSVRVQSWDLRGRTALAAAARQGGPAGGRLTRIAADAARRLDRERTTHATALALALHAGLADVAGDDAGAAALYARAAEALDGLGMAAHAVAARRRRGQLVGGAAGKAAVEAAEAWLARERVKVPDRFAAVLLAGPGLR